MLAWVRSASLLLLVAMASSAAATAWEEREAPEAPEVPEVRVDPGYAGPGAPEVPTDVQAPTAPEAPDVSQDELAAMLREAQDELREQRHEAASAAGRAAPDGPPVVQAPAVVGEAVSDPGGFIDVRILRPAQDQAQRVQRDVEAIVAPEETRDEAAPAAKTSGSAMELDRGTVLVGVAVVAGAAATAGAAAVLIWLAGSSTVGAGAAAPASTEMRRLLPFASPLFTRFEKDTVLGHPKREQLYAIIMQEPGVSLQTLCDRTGLSRTAVTHHLRLIEQQHLVVSKRVGRSRHYYENGGRYGREQKEAYAVLQNDRSKQVADYIRTHPGAIQKSVCEALGLHPSIAHWHVRRLSEAQLVQSVRHGRTVSYFPTPGLEQAAKPAVPAMPVAPLTA